MHRAIRIAAASSRSSGWLARLLLSIVMIGLLGGCRSRSEESAYPNRPIKLYVPFSAGGSSDTFARMLQTTMAKNDLLPQPVAIVNLEGAGGTIGSRRVKDARSDGYSILQLDEAIMIAQSMGRVTYGPESFEPIAATGEIGLVLAVSAGAPYRSLRDLLERARVEPETIAYAANLGAITHYAGLLLEDAYPGAKFRFVQYGGAEARFTAVKGGHIHVSPFSIEEFIRFQTIGLRAIAFFGTERHPALPDVPCTYEQGVRVAISNINYWWAPLGTAADRVSVLADALEAAMRAPELRTRLAGIHVAPLFVRGEPLKKMIEERKQRIARVSPRQDMPLPNLPLITLALIGLLALFGIGESWRSRRKRPADPAPGGPAHNVRLRPDLAIATLLITLAYVLIMAVGIASYPIATLAFVVALGLLLGGVSRFTALATVAIGMAMGPGLQLVLTRIFFVDLP